MLYVALLVFAFALVLLLNTSNASATTTINANIVGDLTLTTADDYVIDGDITVTSTGRLFIEPGVFVNFTAGSSLTIDGYLYANGTLAGPVRMSGTVLTAGSWDGIVFTGPSGSRMTYFEINWADDAVTVVDTAVTLSGTVNYAAGTAVSIIDTAGNLNVGLTALVVNYATNGFYFEASNGNLAATVTNCAMFNIDEVAVEASSPNGNASVSVVGGLYSSPTSGMTTCVLVNAYWNASASITGGAALYFAEIGAVATSDQANAAVTMNNVVIGNVEGAGSTYGAGALTAGRFGVASVSLTNMVLRNATLGALGWALDGGVNIAVSGVTFENVTSNGILAIADELGATVTVTNSDFNNTASAIEVYSNQSATVTITGTNFTNTGQAVYIENNFGGINVVMNRVNITELIGFGIEAYSNEAGLTVSMTDVSMTGFLLSGIGSVYAEVNTTASVTANRFYAAGLFYGLGVFTNGNAVLDVTDATIEYSFYSITVSSGGSVTARVDPTLINHSVYGVLISAVNDVSLTMVDVDMNDTVYCVTVTTDLGDIDFAWTNGMVTGADSTEGGVYLFTDEGSTTASMANVDMEMYADAAWWAFSGDATGSMLYIEANRTAVASVTDCYVNNSWSGVWIVTEVGDITLTVAGLETWNVVKGIFLETPGELSVDVTDMAADNPWTNTPINYDINLFYGNYVLEGYAAGDIDASVDGLVTNFGGGIYLVSDLGSIDFTGNDIVRYLGMLYEPGNGWTTTNMIWLEAPEGAVTADVSNADLEMYPFRVWNGYGLIVVSNLTTMVNINGFDLINASNGVAITSFLGDVALDVIDTTVTDSTNNGFLVYAYEGAMSATFEDVLVNHSWDGNGMVLQSLGDLDLAMSMVEVNDSEINGVLVLSSMGNVNLDLTDVEVLNSGETGLDVTAAMGTIDALVDPSYFGFNEIGIYLDAAMAVTLDILDTVFESNGVGVEVHSQVGGIDIGLMNVEMYDSEDFGLFAEADQDDVMVDCTMSLFSGNGIGIYLATLNDDIMLDIDNTTIELGLYGVFVISMNDIMASIVDSQILGQEEGGVFLSAGHDVVVTYLRDVFDGSSADNAQLFLPSEVEDDYVMIDPDVYTFNSWLTVPLDWGFEFNGVVYDQVTMSRYGWIGFGVTNVNNTYSSFGPGAPNMIAAAQYDWATDEYPGIGYKKYEGSIVFHWYVWDASFPQLKNVFQIWLFENGDVEIRYAMMETDQQPNNPYYGYPYGVNFDSGENWDLRLWRYDVFGNDWLSVHFTMQRLSDGYASWVYGFGNVTATVKDSSVSHWLQGGMLFECVDGVFQVEVSNVSFSYLGGFYEPWAALSFVDYNGTINMMVHDLSFYYIMGLAIAMWDHPYDGGVSDMAIVDCVFEEAVMCGVMWSTVSDPDMEGAFSLEASKSVLRNVGMHAGMFYLETSIWTPGATWDIMAMDLFEDNVIEGNLNPWLMGMMPFAPPDQYLDYPAQFYSDLYFESAADGDSSTWHEVDVLNNVLLDAPSWGFGAVGVEDHIYNTGAGCITSAFDLEAQGNEIRDQNYGFYYGIWGIAEQTVSGTDAGSRGDLTVNVVYLENVLELYYGESSVGLGAQAYQPVTGGLGTGSLEFDLTVLDNTIWYAWTGIYAWSEASVFNAWGATSSDVAVTVQNNDLYTYGDGVDINVASNAVYSHYFPPYETEVDAASDVTFIVDVSGNFIENYYGDGISVMVDNAATEDSYGVFTSAMATSAGEILVYDNELYNWYEADQSIDLAVYSTASTGQAHSTLDVSFTVINNIIYGYGGDGIYIGTGVEAATLEYRYYDTATSMGAADVLVQGNQVWYADYAIFVEGWAQATYGESLANLEMLVDVLNNTVVEAMNEGIYVDIWSDTNYNWGSPEAWADAMVAVNMNSVSGDGWDEDCWAIDVEIYENDNGFGEYVSGSIAITENTVSEAEGGVYVYVWPINTIQATIVNNLVDFCEYGIEVDGAYFLIQDNQVTNGAGDVISTYGGSGSILDNLVTGLPDEESYGINIYGWWNGWDYPAYDVLVQGNDISGCGEDGIYGTDTMYMTITENSIQDCGGSGMYIQGSEDEFDDYIGGELTIVNNEVMNSGENGIFVGSYYDVTIMDNIIDGVGSGYGVWVDEVIGFDIWDNVIANAYGGIGITNSMEGLATNNILSAWSVEHDDDGHEDGPEQFMTGVGIMMDNSEMIVASEMTVTGFMWGVWVYGCEDISFIEVIVTLSVYDGGYFYGTEDLLIQDCAFSMNGEDGLTLVDCDDAVVMDVVVNDNFMYGFAVIGEYSGRTTLYNGVFNNNGEHGLWFTNSVDWIVDGMSEVVNNPVYFNGDLTVMEGGMLWLNLLVDFEIYGDSYDGLAVIMVEEGGMLTAFDVDFFAEYEPDNGMYWYYYEFNVFGGLEFMNVLVTDALELYLGPTSTVEIQTSQIVYNERNGIVVDGCAPEILSSTIAMNPRNGLFVINGASPRITDCMIASNDRGMYLRDGDMSAMIDNVFALNSEAGVLIEDTTGAIHDNIFLFNNKEIYLKGSTISIMDNQIGYSPLADVIVQFAPLLGLMNMSEDVYIPLLDLWVSPESLSMLLTGHIGVYATQGSVVTSTDNYYGMLSTAVMVVDSELSFDDEVMCRTLMVPYMDCCGEILTMSLPVPIYDGILAVNSEVVVNGGHIKVLDDAIFLDGSTADVSDATLEAGDFSLYAVRGSEASLTNVEAGRVRADATSVITVNSALTVVVKDPWGAPLANVPVEVENAQGEPVGEGVTDANGEFVVNVVSYVETAEGKDYSMHPYTVSADFSEVDTSSYPGHDAEFSPAEKSVSIAVPEPTTVVVQTNVIVKYYLSAKATDPNGKVVPGANVVFTSATGTTYSGTTNSQGLFTALVVAYIQTPSGKDTSMEPYSVQVTFPAVGEGYDGRAVFDPHVVGDSVTVEADTVKVIKTGIIMYYELTVEARDRFNRTSANVYLVVTDAMGTIVDDGRTGEDGRAVFEVVGYIQSADGAMDVSMNPYLIEASFGDNPTVATGTADMSMGHMLIVIDEVVEEFNWTLALTIGFIGALLLGLALVVLANRD